jgi:hypothetical protein
MILFEGYQETEELTQPYVAQLKSKQKGRREVDKREIKADIPVRPAQAADLALRVISSYSSPVKFGEHHWLVVQHILTMSMSTKSRIVNQTGIVSRCS